MSEFTLKYPATKAKVMLWVTAVIGLTVITLPKVI